MTEKGVGRDTDYHYRAGFYARQFARGKGRALVGYSEQLHYALAEFSQSCRHDDGCIDADLHELEIEVRDWLMSDQGSQPAAWVDMFVIDSQASGQALRDAKAFLEFMMQKETYERILVPSICEHPRYLMPAREDVYSDEKVLLHAPLYDSFRKVIGRALPLTGPNLNKNLRKIGKQLDENLLPSSH